MKLLGFLVILSFLLASPVRAVSVPSFPSCPNPGGSQIASYPSGTHGIPGDSGTYTGSDSVFQINSGQLVQCFCTASGTFGIQTNWWKTSSLSPEDIATLVSQDWVFVPDGSAWGLDSVSYLAKNAPNSCGQSGNGLSTPSGPVGAPVCTAPKPPTPNLLSIVRSGTAATLTWSAVTPASYYTIGYGLKPNKYIYGVPNTGNVTSFTVGALDSGTTYYFAVRAVNDCTPGDWSGFPITTGGGQILGTSTLAPTGGSFLPHIFLTGGLLCLLLSGISLRRSHRRA